MFFDRKDAALKLAHALDKYKDRDVVVLGIPRGGVEIAYYVALYLNAEFSMVIIRKLGYPQNPEAAFGAVAEDGSLYLSDGPGGSILAEEINAILEIERKEIERRIKSLRKGRPLPDLNGKTVIIVDDGIATGATLFAAVTMCRKKNPSKLIVAAPIASQQMEDELRNMVDDVIVLEKPDSFYAVGQGYRHFQNLTDKETIMFVNAWENRSKKMSYS
jgi:predicted phosphoribosyltransferase